DSLSPWGVVIAGVGNYMTLIMQIVGNCLTVDTSEAGRRGQASGATGRITPEV
ncbi:hypothetical protein M2271_004767, partial [Streptomyces sp. LBL]|nr:hypothetical protein [Streptomyces sp. LBL]